MASKDDIYKSAGLGGSVGFGSRPAIVVIDFQKAFTLDKFPAGVDMSAQCKATRRLTDAAREKNIKVIYTRVGFNKDGIDIGTFGEKCFSNRRITRDTEMYEWDDNLDVREGDVELEKHWPSIFTGTHLVQMLIPMQIDTLILTGCTVGGCVYASAVDACSYGYRTVVCEDAIFDRTQETFDMFLWNMGQKAADISNVDKCIEYFKTLEPLEYNFLYVPD